MNSSRQSLYIVLAINVVAWLMVMALFLNVQVVHAAAPEITEVRWIPQENNKLRVLGQAGIPGERVYVRVPETVGNRHAQADGSFRFNKQGVYPPPCEVHLLPQGGAPGPTHAIADPRDFLTGEAIRHECLPADDKAVIDASESGELPGLGVTTLVDMPTEWCRFDVGAEQRLYWPYTGTGCAPTIEHMDTITAMSVGKSQWVGLGCTMPMRITVFIVPFTPAFSAFVGGAATPDWGDGHILVDTSLSTESTEAIPGSVLHELTHVAQFKEGFTLAELSFAVWSEAVAVAAMMRGMPDSVYWVEAHKEWPIRWTTGMEYGRDESRQLGLFFRYLEDVHPLLLNTCTFMQAQKATLKGGDEITALRDEIAKHTSSPTALEVAFVQFVDAYNRRNPARLPGIEALGPPDNFPVMPSDVGIHAIGNGMLEGGTHQFAIPSTQFTVARTMEASPRCPESLVCALTSRVADTWATINCNTGEYYAPGGGNIFSAGTYAVTVASLAGTAHLRELTYSDCSHPPCIPWPAPDLNDPWQGAACQ